jgi:hypothetical protein
VAGNAVTLEFAGDAKRLQQAARQARETVEEFGDAAARTGDRATEGAAGASRLESRLGSLGAATSGATDAIDSFGSGLQAVADIQDFARAKASRLERAQIDVEQAMADGRQAAIDLEQSFIDLNQAMLDGTQASLDVDQAMIDQEQAMLDASAAQKEYDAAVKEHGKTSDEAKQAALDLKQANQDLAQSGLDLDQAAADAAQSQTDLKQATEDGKQANIDAREAQLNMNDAMHEANPPELQEWVDKINLVTPLLSAVVGILGLVTAAQWLFNASLWGSPVTWIVIGIVALIAVIALLVVKWDWVKEKGAAAWKWIRNAASNAWDWMKDLPGKIGRAFARVGDFIAKPFRSAFNAVSNAWNNTVGNLSWTIPGWVPGIGGNTISAPRLPTFHTGGKVPGMPGQEVPIMALAGEEISAAGTGGSGAATRVTIYLDSDVLVDAVARTVTRRGGRGPGNVQLVLGNG